MQPKARMTFRFDPPAKPSPNPERSSDRISRGIRPPQLESGRESGGQRHDLHREFAGQRYDSEENFGQAIHPGQLNSGPIHEWGPTVAGPLIDDPYTLEEIIRRSDPAGLPSSSAAANPVRFRPNTAGRRNNAASQPELEPEAASKPELDPDASGWDATETPPIFREWFSGKQPQATGPAWWRAFVTVAGAIATGALFGYFVLTLFTGTPVLPESTASGTAAPAQAAGSPDAADKPAAGAQTDAAGPATTLSTVTLPEWTYYMLQYGVFTSEESMQKALEELKSKGLPAVPDISDGYRVYAGGAPTRDEAERLAGQMPTIALFIKPLRGEAMTADLTVSGEFGTFVRLSHELATRLSELSVAALQDEKPKPLGEAQLSEVREIHRQWLAASASAEGLTEPASRAAQEMIRALSAAMVSIDDYTRKVSRFHLWRVQADVMDTVLADRSLRSAVRT